MRVNGPGREESSRLQAGGLVTGRAQDRAGGEARSRAGRGGLVELKTKRPAGPVLVFGLAGQAARAGVGCAWPWILLGFGLDRIGLVSRFVRFGSGLG